MPELNENPLKQMVALETITELKFKRAKIDKESQRKNNEYFMECSA